MKPFALLRGLIEANGLVHADVARAAGISVHTFSQRMTCVQPWTLPEMYRVADLLGIPDDSLFRYFPRDGGIDRRKPRHPVQFEMERKDPA